MHLSDGVFEVDTVVIGGFADVRAARHRLRWTASSLPIRCEGESELDVGECLEFRAGSSGSYGLDIATGPSLVGVSSSSR
jgi:hypothetical protein